eukprot:SAG22_NODE_472_length_10094_cov_6.762581_2_plen_85_part_00
MRRSCLFLGGSLPADPPAAPQVLRDLLALVGTEGEFHKETADGLAARLAVVAGALQVAGVLPPLATVDTWASAGNTLARAPAST